MVRARLLLPGLAWTAAIALVAWLLAKVVPLLGAPVLAILIGLAVSAVRRPAIPATSGSGHRCWCTSYVVTSLPP
jgi:uncharacterized membrane protein YadS